MLHTEYWINAMHAFSCKMGFTNSSNCSFTQQQTIKAMAQLSLTFVEYKKFVYKI
jgi:hypothetical protein